MAGFRLVAVALVLLLALAACSGGSPSTQTPSATEAPTATATAAAAPQVTVRGGDPAVYSEALARLQEYFEAWVRGDVAAMNEIVPPDNQTAPTPALPPLASGSVTGYQSVTHESDNHFQLSVRLQLHFASSDTAAWAEGTNTRFVTFERSASPGPFTLTFATSAGP